MTPYLIGHFSIDGIIIKESIKYLKLNQGSVFDKNAAGSTMPCYDEHLYIKVFKTCMYLICGFRNPYEAESEKWQNSYQLSIGLIFC